MEKKLPKVFANKIEGKAGNNEDVYCSFDNKEDRTAEAPSKLKGKKCQSETK